MAWNLGGQIKTIEHIHALRSLSLNLGEILLGEKQQRQKWREIQFRAGGHKDFRFTGHGPSEGPPEDLDNLREKYLPALYDTVDLSGLIGIGYLTIHLWMDSRFVSKRVIDEKLCVLKDLVSYAGENSVEIGLENLSEPAKDLERALHAIPDLKITLDVGHAQLLTEKNRSLEIFEECGERVAHLHIHDNNGGADPRDDKHLPVGAGIIDFQAIIHKALECEYKGDAILELEHKDLAESVVIIRAELANAKRRSISPPR